MRLGPESIPANKQPGKLWTALALGLATAAGPGARGAAAGKVDWHDLARYVHRLERSSSPETRAIVRQIENGPRDLAQQRALARSEAIPLSRDELRAPSPPPEQNAAPIYVRIGALLKEKPVSEADDEAATRLCCEFPHTTADLARVRRLLTARRQLFDLIHEAADRPACVLPPVPPLALGGLLHSLHTFADLREVARLLKAEAFVQAVDGHFPEAIADEARGLRVAEHAAAPPEVLTFLVAFAIHSLAVDGMEDILYRAGPNEKVAQAVRDAIATYRPRFALRPVLEGELVQGLGKIGELRRRLATGGPAAVLAALDEGEPPAHPSPRSERAAAEERDLWGRELDAGEARYLRDMRRLILHLEEPYWASRATFNQLLKQEIALPESPVRPVLWTAFYPTDALVPQLRARARAREEVVMTAADVLAYKARCGAWPDDLAQAPASPPLDPLTGKPLGYRREGGGFVVYSRGVDGQFNGGRAGDGWYFSQACFRYPAPPPYRPLKTPPPLPRR